MGIILMMVMGMKIMVITGTRMWWKKQYLYYIDHDNKKDNAKVNSNIVVLIH